MDKAKGFLVEKVAHIKKPEAKLADVDFTRVNRDSATLLGKLEVVNPYDHDLPICEISYTFKSADKYNSLSLSITYPLQMLSLKDAVCSAG